MSIEPFILFFLITDAKKKLDTPELKAKWSAKATYALYAIVALFAMNLIVGHGNNDNIYFSWLWHACILYVLWIFIKNKEFQYARNILYAVIPVIIVSIIYDLVKFLPGDFGHSVNSYVGFAFPFSIVWMVYMFITTRKQQKALEKEKKQRAQEEEINKVIATKKNELEIMVQQRTAEIVKQKEELEHALEELKATQSQLIQSEKMASLGVLTAGIAHEIQNPLNFVNNFSELNTELIDEMKHELETGNNSEAITIANDISNNLEKINYHGKRADAIVKSMLQHSRQTSGQREFTDINALCDEYMRLAYHGLRAKDSTFNAKFETDFDATIPKVEIVPQDIGRVLLNLLNNAFYAVSEKKKNAATDFKPFVKMQTKNIKGKIEITITDNGGGIPQKVIDKIFQPFFTTKPTGEGTGLGLSLSYDIIKAHNGNITADTKENEGTTFTIQLPVD